MYGLYTIRNRKLAMESSQFRSAILDLTTYGSACCRMNVCDEKMDNFPLNHLYLTMLRMILDLYIAL